MDLETLKEFKNEPYIDFSKEENKEKLTKEVEEVKKQFSKVYPLVINGKRINDGKLISIKNPANLEEELGKVHLGTTDNVALAINAAVKSFESWQDVPYYERASKLLKAAETARKRKLELSVWLSKENGKSIYEAVADVAEGIDFMEYYARRMNEIGSTKVEGIFNTSTEKNNLIYVPLGAGAVISPWNFPFAILIGMVTAAIVTGNTTIMKPSTATPIIANKAFEILEQAGFPAGVVNYLPASGESIGNNLIKSPDIRFISFTGSTAVGKEIYGLGAQFNQNQKWFKRIILETGGKNHIIVSNDTEIKKAAEGVAKSAFGYSGQKCSACSVAVVDERVYDHFLNELLAYVKTLKLGEGVDSSSFTGPVINEDSINKILNYIDLGNKEGKLLLGGKKPEKVNDKNGYYVEPTIFTELPEDSKLLKEEIFGPVLSIRKSKNFEHALSIVNAGVYGLTGGVFTNNPKDKELAIKKFQVGNLYINKFSGGSTGAMVGRQPFGGFNMSGTDSKAGGPNYLYLFMQEKSIADLS